MELTIEQTKQMRRIFPSGWERSDIPALWRKDEGWECDEDVSVEYREELDQERLCQEAQDNAMADSRYIDRALEAGREAGREMFY